MFSIGDIRRVSSQELESTPKGRGGHVLGVSKFRDRHLSTKGHKQRLHN